jgi:hypothetical protein
MAQAIVPLETDYLTRPIYIRSARSGRIGLAISAAYDDRGRARRGRAHGMLTRRLAWSAVSLPVVSAPIVC